MSVLSYPFHSLPLKLSNEGINFLFPPLKLPNKRREEYSKIILFIHFHSIPFPPPKRGLSILSYPFHSLPLKLLNKRMYFPFPPLKLPNKGMKEYSKIILFIHFHSLIPNEALNSQTSE